jgi:hypothetical protein
MKKTLLLLLIGLGGLAQLTAQTNNLDVELFVSGSAGVFNYYPQYKDVTSVRFGDKNVTMSDPGSSCNGQPIYRDAINTPCFDGQAFNLTFEEIESVRHNFSCKEEYRAFPGSELPSVNDTIYLRILLKNNTSAPYIRLKIKADFNNTFVKAAKLIDVQGPGTAINLNGVTDYDYTINVLHPINTIPPPIGSARSMRTLLQVTDQHMAPP